MDKHFEFHKHEDQIYKLWEENGVFNPDQSKNKNNSSPFSVILPLPNANDPLHIGHGLFLSLQDTMTRFHRMKGDDTVWIPGTDHAGIETQFVFEKKLQKEGKSRFDFDRKTLFDKIWQYVEENSDLATRQMKKIGSSADWSRFKFSLDPDVVDFVLVTFEKMYQDSLVYRDLKLVNFCTKCGTSYSELEVVHQDQQTPLYFVKYPLQDSPGRFVTVATVRPEPIFADTALAVNPKDKKNKHLIGKVVLNPLTDEEMQIIGDECVDPDFGTGVVKITPAHDQDDFEVAKRHNLPVVEAINTRGKITSAGGKYAGLSVKKAREAVVADLETKDLIEKIDHKYQNRIGTCYRCGSVIEPLPMAQFFIKVNDKKTNLTKMALEALDSKKTKILGAGQEKILRHWLGNLKDWNISRQIVWGITIPVWYQVAGYEDQIEASFINSNGEFKHGSLEELLKKYSLSEILDGLQQTNAAASVPYLISRDNPSEATTEVGATTGADATAEVGAATEVGHSTNGIARANPASPTTTAWFPETDTFDTWFSSSQWPVITLSTNQPGDLERFYPTSVMETAYDILMFWVMRMMMMGTYLTGKTPFQTVYLHGLIRDEKGQKMSKSKGNTINPLEIIEEFGADALRMALMIRSTPGQDKNVGIQDIRAMRNFTNKIWNASRFVIMSKDTEKDTSPSSGGAKSAHIAQFNKKLHGVVVRVSTNLNKLQIGIAADTIYDEFWHWFCDTCIEDAKNGTLPRSSIIGGLTTFLKLLHPFAPFVTEAIWQELRQEGIVQDELLATSDWPS